MMAATGKELVTLDQIKLFKNQMVKLVTDSSYMAASYELVPTGTDLNSLTAFGKHVYIAAQSNDYTISNRPTDTACIIDVLEPATNTIMQRATETTGTYPHWYRIGTFANNTYTWTTWVKSDGDTQHPGKGGDQTVSIGKGSNTPSDGNIAIGYDATVPGDNMAGGEDTIAIGRHSEGKAALSVAIGGSAKVYEACNVAIGHEAKAAFEGTAIGTRSSAVGHRQSVAIGFEANAKADKSIAIGSGSIAEEMDTVSFGAINHEDGITATRRIVNISAPIADTDAATKAYVDTKVASGSYTLPPATTSTLGGVKIGTGISITDDGTISAASDGNHAGAGEESVAIGSGAEAKDIYTVAVGVTAKSIGYRSLSVGGNSSASSRESTVIGAFATASADYTAAIGNSARASAEFAVAVGGYSVANEPKTVSFGGNPSINTRRLVNVTDPVNAQDAATKNYVDALKTKLTALESRVARLEAGGSGNAGLITAGSPTAHGSALDELYTVSKQ